MQGDHGRNGVDLRPNRHVARHDPAPRVADPVEQVRRRLRHMHRCLRERGLARVESAPPKRSLWIVRVAHAPRKPDRAPHARRGTTIARPFPPLRPALSRCRPDRKAADADARPHRRFDHRPRHRRGGGRGRPRPAPRPRRPARRDGHVEPPPVARSERILRADRHRTRRTRPGAAALVRPGQFRRGDAGDDLDLPLRRPRRRLAAAPPARARPGRWSAATSAGAWPCRPTGNCPSAASSPR
jgi:hypothetical protein